MTTTKHTLKQEIKMSEQTPIDVFGEDSREATVYKIMREFRISYADMLTGKLQEVIAKCDEEHKSDVMAILNKTFGDSDDSVLSHFITHATHCMDTMVGMLGGNSNPLGGVYDAVGGQLSYTSDLEPLDTNESGWPILDCFKPGHICLRINYRAATELNEEFKSNSVYFIRSDGELHPMLWVDIGLKSAVNKAMQHYGINDETHASFGGKWFLVTKDHVSPLREAAVHDSERMHGLVMNSEIPFYTPEVFGSCMEDHKNELVLALATGELVIHTDESIPMREGSSSVAISIYQGKVSGQVFGEVNIRHSASFPISEYAAEVYTDILMAYDEEVFTRDCIVVLEMLYDL